MTVTEHAKRGSSPKETIDNNYLCPVCGKKVTVGVLHRVEKLADRAEGVAPSGAPPYYSLIPLAEIIAETLGVGRASKAVDRVYQNLIEKLGNEFTILMDTSLDDIERAGSPLIREAIARVRAGKVHIAPGYDGEFGTIRIFADNERERNVNSSFLVSSVELKPPSEIPSVLRARRSQASRNLSSRNGYGTCLLIRA